MNQIVEFFEWGMFHRSAKVSVTVFVLFIAFLLVGVLGLVMSLATALAFPVIVVPCFLIWVGFVLPSLLSRFRKEQPERFEEDT